MSQEGKKAKERFNFENGGAIFMMNYHLFSFLFAFCVIRSLLVSMVDMLCFHSVCLASNQKGFKTINCGLYMYLT